jgi:hypothetical protein
MGIFKIKTTKDAFGKIARKALRTFFGKDIEFTELSISLKMEEMPDEQFLEKLTAGLKKAGIDTEKVKGTWIKI